MAAKLRAPAGSVRTQAALVGLILGIAAVASLLLPAAAKATTPDPSTCIHVGEVFAYDPSVPNPANDFFADAVDLSPADTGCATVDNTNADLFGSEPDEVVSQSQTATKPQSPSGSGQTVWFTWTPTDASGRSAIFDTDGTAVSNTIVTVYSSSVPSPTLADLQPVPESVAGGPGIYTRDGLSENPAHMWRCRMQDRLSCFEFIKPVTGTTYYIQIDTETGTSGPIQLNWQLAPLAPSLPHFVVAGSPDLDANSVAHTATPSFQFNDTTVPPYSDPHYICTIDDNAVVDNNCTSGWQPSALSNGPHKFTVALKDPDTNLPGDTATVNFTVDVVVIAPPTTPVIDTKPAKISGSSTASFTYHDGPTGVSYLCSLDSIADSDFGPCPGEPDAQTYSGLVDGSHVFYVKALNAAGVESLPAMYMWTVDTRAPAAPVIVSGPPSPTSSTTGDLNVSASLGTGESLRCNLVPGFATFVPCSPGLITYVGLTDGSYTFSTKAVDSAGNSSATVTYTWTVDTAPPPAPIIDTKPPSPSGSPSAPFTFHDAEPGVSFSCKIDGGSYGPCQSQYGPLGDGPHTFCVKAADSLGNTSTATCYTWTIDTTPPPAPQIDSSPPALTSSSNGAFTYHDAEDPSVTYQCQLDGGGFGSCATSGKSYSSLADGTHTFKVRAVDAAGNVSPAASYSWVIDSTPPPSPVIDTHPASLTSSPHADFTFHDSEDPNVSFSCSLDGSPFGPCPAAGYSALSDGSHTFSVKATDLAGNTSSAASYTWTVDTTPPILGDHPNMLAEASSPSGASVGFTSPTATDAIDPSPAVSCSPGSGSTFPLGATTVTCTATDAAGNHTSKTFTVTVRDSGSPTLADHPDVTAPATSASGAVVSYTPPTASDTVDPSPSVSCTPAPGSTFPLGTTTVTCTATDASGNQASKTFSVIVSDKTPPLVADHSSVTAEASSPSGAVVNYTPPTATDAVDPSPSLSCALPSGSSFPMGATTVTCTATDAAGNSSSKSFTVTVGDTTPPPAPVIDTNPPLLSGSPGASFTYHDSESDVTFVCALDGGAYGPCSSSYGPLADGPHTFCVKAKDAFGNASAATCYQWTIDTTPPPAPIIDTKPSSQTSSTSASFTYHDVEPGVSYECSIDGGPFTLCLSLGQAYGGPLADGPHTFSVRALDSLGNRSPAASYVWTVDTRAPLTTITDQPPASSDSGSASFRFTADESPATFTCTLDGAPVTCHSGTPYSGLSTGTHTLAVYATDAAGNRGPAQSVTWQIVNAAGCNIVGDVHANANFTTTIGGKKASIHVEVEGDCDSIKVHDDDDDDAGPLSVGANGIYLHHSKVQVQISGVPGGDNKLIDAKQMSNNSKYKDVTSVQLSPASGSTPETAVLRGTYNGAAFVVTLTDSNAKGNANDTVQVSYPSFPTGVLSAPHQDVNIKWN